MMPMLSRTAAGALAGLLATIPMTVAMEMMHRRLRPENRYHLPPYELTMNALQQVGLARRLNPRSRRYATLALHFGYGALVGALYPMLCRRPSGNRLALGAAYGVGIWSASYLGWIPAARLLTPAVHHPAQRNLLMLAAHLVWGSSLSLFQRGLEGGEARGAVPVSP